MLRARGGEGRRCTYLFISFSCRRLSSPPLTLHMTHCLYCTRTARTLLSPVGPHTSTRRTAWSHSGRKSPQGQGLLGRAPTISFMGIFLSVRARTLTSALINRVNPVEGIGLIDFAFPAGLIGLFCYMYGFHRPRRHAALIAAAVQHVLPNRPQLPPPPPPLTGHPLQPPDYNIAQIVQRNPAVVHRNAEGEHYVCPTLRNRNRTLFEGAPDLWTCMSCLRKGKRTIFLQPNPVAKPVARRDNPAQAAHRHVVCNACQMAANLESALGGNIAVPPPRALPAWACHDVDSCLYCTDHILVMTTHKNEKTKDGNVSVVDTSQPAGKLLAMRETGHAAILADEEDAWATIVDEAQRNPMGKSEYARRCEHIVGTRLQKRSDGADLIGEIHSAASRTLRGVDRVVIAKYARHALEVVTKILAREEKEAREITKNLELQRTLAEHDGVGWRHSMKRFWIAYYHPRAGPDARSWLHSLDRAFWAWSLASD